MADIANLTRPSLSRAAHQRRRADTASSEIERLARLEIARMFEARAVRKASTVGRLIARERSGVLAAGGQRHPAGCSPPPTPGAIPFGSSPVGQDWTRLRALNCGHAATGQIGGAWREQLRCSHIARLLRQAAFAFAAAFLVAMSLTG